MHISSQVFHQIEKLYLAALLPLRQFTVLSFKAADEFTIVVVVVVRLEDVLALVPAAEFVLLLPKANRCICLITVAA